MSRPSDCGLWAPKQHRVPEHEDFQSLPVPPSLLPDPTSSVVTRAVTSFCGRASSASQPMITTDSVRVQSESPRALLAGEPPLQEATDERICLRNAHRGRRGLRRRLDAVPGGVPERGRAVHGVSEPAYLGLAGPARAKERRLPANVRPDDLEHLVQIRRGGRPPNNRSACWTLGSRPAAATRDANTVGCGMGSPTVSSALARLRILTVPRRSMTV